MKNKLSVYILIPLVLMNISSIFPLVLLDSKEGSWDVVAEAAEEYATGKILIYASENIYPFEVYYQGAASLFTIPNEIDRDSFDIDSIVIRNKEHLDNRFQELIDAGEKFVLIGAMGWNAYRGVKFNTHLLEEYIPDNFHILDYRIIDGTSIYYLSN